MIVTNVEIDGVEFNDYQRAKVSKSTDENNSSSNFQITYDSPFGRHATSFRVGQELVLKVDEDVPPQPFAHYKLNDDAANTTVVDSIHGTNGTLSGGNNTEDITVVGKINNALSFDGASDYVDIGALGFTRASGEPITVAAWVKTDSDSGDFVIAGTRSGSSAGDLFKINKNGTQWGFQYDPTGSGDSVNGGTVSVGVWTHVCGTYDGKGTITLYVDGTQVSQSTGNDAAAIDKDNFSIAARIDSLGEYFDGDIDDVRVYKIGLTTDQVAFLYNSGTGTESNNGKPINTLITGIIERIKFEGNENIQRVRLIGRDYSQRLQDSTVEPTVFTNAEISTIVTDIIGDNVDDITTTNVNVTETTLPRIQFNHSPVFNALKKLAELSGFFFYVDEDKDLHFKKRDDVSSDLVFDNTNINVSVFNQTREGMANDVTVYGDRVLSGFEETQIADGGSAFTLLSKPRNNLITVSGVPQKGGIFELTVSPTSGPNYLVNFDDKKIIFMSGTSLGYDSVPTSGDSIIFQYDRDIPLIKAGVDRESINLFGRKESIINDKSINDPNTATDILKAELKKSNPFKGVEINIKGWYDITPGNTVRVTLSDFDIDEDVGILNATYIFDKNTINSEKVIRIKLDKKIKDITDELTIIRNRLNAIEAGDRQETDFLTRLEQSSNNVIVVGSTWAIQQRFNGSGFILGGLSKSSGGGVILGILGSIAGSVSYLGTAGRTTLETVQSGGFYV